MELIVTIFTVFIIVSTFELKYGYKVTMKMYILIGMFSNLFAVLLSDNQGNGRFQIFTGLFASLFIIKI